MALQLSCQPFTVTRFVARSIEGPGERRMTEREATADARRMLRAGWPHADIFRVQWDPVTGIKGKMVLLTTLRAEAA